jgi:dienelactone hydrolase
MTGMTSRVRTLLASAGFAWMALAGTPATAQVEALFDLSTPATGPFPTNAFTVVDLSQLSNRRVALPLPDCGAVPESCAMVEALNALDGFNMQPRVRIPFDGAIDVSSVSSSTLFLVHLGNTASPVDRRRGEVIGVDQIVFDPETRTLAAESERLLRQHTRYALIATSGIRDTLGRPVRGTGLARFLRDRRAAREAGLEDYRTQLRIALEVLRIAGITDDRVVSASIFTTQSSTAVLEKMRREVLGTRPEVPDFARGARRERTVFPLDDVASLTFERQVGTAPTFQSSSLPVAALGVVPNSVSAIAFGSYASPSFLGADRRIPAVGTRTGRPRIQGTSAISFVLFLPAGPRPATGWPVAIGGHGLGGNKYDLFVLASALASQGIATAAIDVVGHGGGAAGTLTVTRTDGTRVVVASGGRGVDVNGDGAIEGTEGFGISGLVGTRDTLRQTVVDLVQLVRSFRTRSVDVDDDGKADFDPARVFYVGASLGGNYGTLLLGIEPGLRAGALNVPGGALPDVVRLSPDLRPFLLPNFTTVPSLLNVQSVAPPLFGFDENLPLRNVPPLVNDVPGAARLQEAIDDLEWMALAGDPLGYARHIRADPLAGNRPKPVIVQVARGDMVVPNPTSTALVRAGELADRVTLFRNDLFVQQLQAAGQPAAVLNTLRNPHAFIGALAGPRARAALQAQMQIAAFFASNGALTLDPDGAEPLFETPIGALPEDLGFLPPFPDVIPSP